MSPYLQLPPSQESWTDLCSALSWIVWGRAKPLTEILPEDPSPESVDQLLGDFQLGWTRLADAAAGGRLSMRGRPMIRGAFGEEMPMVIGHFRAFGILDLLKKKRILCVRAHPRTFGGYEDDFLTKKAHGFAYVFVRRDDLLNFHSEVEAIRKAAQLQAAQPAVCTEDASQAADWLRAELKAREVRSVRRDDILTLMKSRFGMSQRAAERIWSAVVSEFPGWSKPGRPRRTVRGR